jgi:ABC-type transport system involved in multi-copper enzyme maturation permease subunit
LSALASLVARHIRALTSDYALLAVLDARRAALALAWLLSAGLAVAVLAVTAWLALVTGAVVWLLGSGASWTAALGVAALSNILGAVALGLWMRGFFRELPFAATLRQLKGEAPAPEGES